jgi:hypothetical protein
MLLPLDQYNFRSFDAGLLHIANGHGNGESLRNRILNKFRTAAHDKDEILSINSKEKMALGHCLPALNRTLYCGYSNIDHSLLRGE